MFFIFYLYIKHKEIKIQSHSDSKMKKNLKGA